LSQPTNTQAVLSTSEKTELCTEAVEARRSREPTTKRWKELFNTHTHIQRHTQSKRDRGNGKA